MRKSEACAIKRQDVYCEGDEGIIRYYSPKMRKEVTNYIPLALYELLQLQDKFISETYSKDEIYLFRTRRVRPFRSSQFSFQMNLVCNKYNIRTPEGELYRFRAHDFRHGLATYLADNNYPIQIIQKILHHKSLTMLQVYVDDTDEKNRQRYFNLIKQRGLEIDPAIENSENLMKLEWIKANIHARMLPNGVCVLPPLAGNCPHEPNVCLVCDYFRTGSVYLSVHKRHYSRACFALQCAKESGLTEEISRNEKLCQNLSRTILNIESEITVNSWVNPKVYLENNV
jgi:hypothetical protein